MTDDQTPTITLDLTYDLPPADTIPLERSIADRRRAQIDAEWAQYLARQATPEGEPKAEKPSAIVTGVKAGASSAAAAAGNIVSGLARLISFSPVSGETLPEQIASGLKDKIDASKQTILGGFAALGFSPFVGTAAGWAQALENASPGISETVIADGAAAAGIRGLLVGKAYKDMSPEERAQAMAPMTVKEALETVGPFLVPVVGGVAKGAAKVGKAVVKEGIRQLPEATRGALLSQRGSVGPPGGEPTPVGESRINVKRMDATESVKTAMGAIDAIVGQTKLAEHRKVKTHAQTIEESRGTLTWEQIAAMDPAKTLLMPPETTALRDMADAAVAHSEAVAQRVKAGDVAARAELPGAFAAAVSVVGPREGNARNLARGLNAHAIPSQAGRAGDVGAFARMAETVGSPEGISVDALADLILSSSKPKARQQSFWNQVAAVWEAGSNAFYEAWINALLSNPQTHAANTLSNALTTVYAPTERWLAERLHWGKDPGVFRGEGMAMFRGFTEAARDAIRLRSKFLEQGQFGRAKVEDLPAISGEGLHLSGPMGRAADVLGAGIRTPTSALRAEDAFFKAINYRMELKAQAHRQAMMEGRTGTDYATRVRDIEANPHFFPAIHEAAQQFALVQTFNSELTGISSQIAGAAQSLREIPGGRVLLPFVRTPTNIAQYAAQRTPLLNLISQNMRRDLASGAGVRRDLAMSKLATSILFASAIIPLAMSGVITGPGPSDPKLRKQKRDLEGWQPNSIKIGNTYYAYNRLDPVGAQIGILAAFVEIAGQIPEADALTLSTAIILAPTRTMLSKTYVEGMANVFDALENPVRGEKAVAQGLVRSLVPAGVRAVERMTDPTLREVDSLLDEVRAGVPGWSKTLPPQRNIFAEPIVPEGGWGPDFISPVYVSTAKDDPVAAEIQRLKVRLTEPPRYLSGQKPPAAVMEEPRQLPPIKLSDEAWDRFKVLAGAEVRDNNGRNFRQRLEYVMSSLVYQKQSDWPDGGKAMMIANAHHEFKDRALIQLRREYDDVDQALKAHEMEEISRKVPITNPRATPRPETQNLWQRALPGLFR